MAVWSRSTGTSRPGVKRSHSNTVSSNRLMDADATLAQTSGFDQVTTRVALPGVGVEETSLPSTPPVADSLSTTGFDAATTSLVALPGVGAEGTILPPAPPDADAPLAPTNGFGVVDPRVTKPELDPGVISTSASARVATVFLILRKPVPWRKRRMASSGRGALLPTRTLWPMP